MKNILKMKEVILDILFPPICLHCRKHLTPREKPATRECGERSSRRMTAMLCDACAGQIHIHTTLFCAECRARLPDNKKICHKDSSYILAAAVNYDGPVKDLIHQLKYRRWTSVINAIRPILETYIGNLSLSVDDYLIIPIPLHPDRQRERGFNQAELIGTAISESLRLPMRTDLLRRIKKTKAQAELKDYKERAANIANAFSAGGGPASGGEIKNKNIILVDDVYTSGATINDAVRALRDAGVKKIIAFTFAKTR